MMAFEKSCGLIALLDGDDEVAVFDCDVLIVEFEEFVAVSALVAVDELALLVVAVLVAVDWLAAVLVGFELPPIEQAVTSIRITSRTGMRRPICRNCGMIIKYSLVAGNTLPSA
jgi:hypothetical protein